MVSTKFSLKDKTILITGASSGIGKQSAIEISNSGANLIITGRNKTNLKKTLALCKKGNHKLIISDLTNNIQLENLVSKIDKIDGIVHSAGISNSVISKFINSDIIYEMMDINFRAPVLLTSLLLRNKKINKEASLIFMSSIATIYPVIGSALYTSSKSALEGFVKTLSLEIAPKKMRANCLLPSFVDTPMINEIKPLINDKTIASNENLLKLGIGTPTDVANTIIFLLSDEARWITGENIKIIEFSY